MELVGSALRVAAAVPADEFVAAACIAADADCPEELTLAWLSRFEAAQLVTTAALPGDTAAAGQTGYRLPQASPAGAEPASIVAAVIERWPEEAFGLAHSVEVYIRKNPEATVRCISCEYQLPETVAEAVVISLVERAAIAPDLRAVASLPPEVLTREPVQAWLPFALAPSRAAQLGAEESLLRPSGGGRGPGTRFVFRSLAYHAAVAAMRAARAEGVAPDWNLLRMLVGFAARDADSHPLTSAATGLVMYAQAQLPAEPGAADRDQPLALAAEALKRLSGSGYKADADEVESWLKQCARELPGEAPAAPRPAAASPASPSYREDEIRAAWSDGWLEAVGFLRDRDSDEEHMALGRLAGIVARHLPGATARELLAKRMLPGGTVVGRWDREARALRTESLGRVSLASSNFAYLLEARRPAPVIVLGDPVPDRALISSFSTVVAPPTGAGGSLAGAGDRGGRPGDA